MSIYDHVKEMLKFKCNFCKDQHICVFIHYDRLIEIKDKILFDIDEQIEKCKKCEDFERFEEFLNLQNKYVGGCGIIDLD